MNNILAFGLILASISVLNSVLLLRLQGKKKIFWPWKFRKLQFQGEQLVKHYWEMKNKEQRFRHPFKP